MFSMLDRVFCENFFESTILSFACIKNLRRVSDLIDWNWNSSIEFRLIAKIFILNELSSVDFATKQTLNNWSIRKTRKRYFCLYVTQVLSELSFCSSCQCKMFWFSRSVCSSKRLKWFFRMYNERRYWYNAKDVFSKNFRSKNQELEFDILNYWWFLMFDDSVLNLTCWLLLRRSKIDM